MERQDPPKPEPPVLPVLVNIKQLHESVVALTKERDALRTELLYAKQVIQQLASHGQQCLEAFDEASVALDRVIRATSVGSPKLSTAPEPSSGEWVKGVWLRSIPDRSFLGEAEEEWHQYNYQRALALLSKLLVRPDLTNKTRINAKLLLCSILRDCDRPGQGLAIAEEALELAGKCDDQDALRKTQVFRGLCLLSMCQYAEASWSLALGQGTKHYDTKIQEWKATCDQKCWAVPDGDLDLFIEQAFTPVRKT